MTAAEVRALVERYFAALDARDWEAFAACLAEDVVYTVPQTRERVRGREGYLDFNATFPGAWRIPEVRIVADETGAAARFVFEDGGERQTAVAFFDVAGGRIARIEDFWPDPYEPPPRRSRFVERT